MNSQWDLFISHASEDKATIAKPLADELKNYGISVWYDEFELKLGDSLSRSIDYGLIHSTFGLVVLSENFFAKQWTEYELQSLLAKNTSGKRVILPVWHNISKETIQQYSLYLSDIKALSTNLGIKDLSFEIMKRVRPDILDSHLRIYLSRKIEKESNVLAEIPHELLNDSKIQHKALPSYLITSCRLIEEVFHDILNTSYVEIVENFAKDWDYEREFIVWSVIANAYITFIRETHCDFDNLDKKKEAFSLLLDYSLTGHFDMDINKYKLLNAAEQTYLVECYILNHKHIHEMMGTANNPNV